MEHGRDPIRNDNSPEDDPELGLVTADMDPFLLLYELCECQGTCMCEERIMNGD